MHCSAHVKELAAMPIYGKKNWDPNANGFWSVALEVWAIRKVLHADPMFFLTYFTSKVKIGFLMHLNVTLLICVVDFQQLLNEAKDINIPRYILPRETMATMYK